MDHYLDVRLLPAPEFSSSILMNALFSKLHRELVKLNSTGIGVSFPNFNRTSLGGCLRLHGARADLAMLMNQSWLNGMRDYADCSEVRLMPDRVGYCRVKRVQIKSNAERLRRRHEKRHPEVSKWKLREIIPDRIEKRLETPYVRLKSTSTGQNFLLFIHQVEVPNRSSGSFNAYGLSSSATLPWF